MVIHKRGRGFELGTTENKSSWRSGRDLNSGPPNCKTTALTARPHCLLIASAVSLTQGITHGYSKVVDNKDEGGEAQTSVIKNANSHISPTLGKYSLGASV